MKSGQGQSGEEVSIAFNLASVPPGSSDLDIEYSQWRYFNGGLQKINPPGGHVFVNNLGDSDHKPVSLHGPSSLPYLRRVYFDRTNLMGQHSLLYYDTDSDLEFIISNSDDAFRAAVSYAKVGSTDNVAVCYEDVLYPSVGVPTKKRIVLRVD